MRTAAQPLGDSWRRREGSIGSRDGSHAHGRGEVRDEGHANRGTREGTACMCISGDEALHCTLEGQHGIRRMNAIAFLQPQD